MFCVRSVDGADVGDKVAEGNGKHQQQERE